MDVIERPSPNHDARPHGAEIDILLLHYTGMREGEEALARLRDAKTKVSSHYLIDEDGRTIRLVDENRRAWHAGQAHWAGHDDVNGRSIGIELVNPGHEFGYRDFPRAQMSALSALAKDILSRHAIPAHRVLGHSDVAPARREDPGERFDWASLADQGIGLWPNEVDMPDGARAPSVAELQSGLARLGYGVRADGTEDTETRLAIQAFHRHWHPRHLWRPADASTLARLQDLVARLP